MTDCDPLTGCTFRVSLSEYLDVCEFQPSGWRGHKIMFSWSSALDQAEIPKAFNHICIHILDPVPLECLHPTTSFDCNS